MLAGCVVGGTLGDHGENQTMSVNTALSVNDTIKIPVTSGKLSAFQHFPLPIFLFTKKLELIETNHQGEKALDNHWVGVSANKLHFNSRENNEYVKRVIDRLDSLQNDDSGDQIGSERFVLRNIDNVCRAYTLSRESRYTDNLVLTIQGDITCSDAKIEILARAFGLSMSESRIVKMMVKGMKPKEIAYEAGISLNTVRSHLRTLYAKMQVRDYNDALTQAVRLLV